jgi:hypothetical protein
MGMESDHNGLTANALRQYLHLVEDGLVTKMDAVEGADGDYGVRNISSFYDVSKDFHL